MSAMEKNKQQPAYAKYDTETRIAIGKLILKEWDKMKGEIASADAFINHATDMLKKAGYKSPIGRVLTPRTVRYQVFRNGIRFRRADRKAPPAPRYETPAFAPAQQPAHVPAPQQPTQTPAGMSPVLSAILTDRNLTEEQRGALIKAFYGVK